MATRAGPAAVIISTTIDFMRGGGGRNPGLAWAAHFETRCPKPISDSVSLVSDWLRKGAVVRVQPMRFIQGKSAGLLGKWSWEGTAAALFPFLRHLETPETHT